MKFFCYLFLVILISPIAGVTSGILFDNYLIRNTPEILFGVVIFISATLIFCLYLHRSSYKYLNDFILTFFTGLIAITYLMYGKKIGEVIPSYEMMKSDKYYYYLTITKLIIVADCLLAKLFINLDEFISNRIKENKVGGTTSIYDAILKRTNYFKN